MSEMWNLWHGCHKKSEGCQHCYVYRRDAEFEKDSNVVTKTASFNLPIRRDRSGNWKVPSGTLMWTCFTSDFFIEEAFLSTSNRREHTSARMAESTISLATSRWHKPTKLPSISRRPIGSRLSRFRFYFPTRQMCWFTPPFDMANDVRKRLEPYYEILNFHVEGAMLYLKARKK